MKTLFYIFSIFFVAGSFAQSNYYQTVMDNSDGDAAYLEKSPWNQAKLIQITEVFDQNSNHLFYNLFEVSAGVSSQISIPSCSEILSKPTFLDDGILVTGETSSGVECMFFDGISTTVFDLNSGIGDSDPSVHVLENRVFIIANDGGYDQLYEFDKITHTLTSITYGASSVFAVCAIWGDVLYFSTKDFNSMTSEFEFKLISVDFSGSLPSSSIIREISLPMNPLKEVYWDSPQIKWGKLYLTEDIYSLVPAAATDLKIISIDQNNQVIEVHQDSELTDRVSELFEWDDALWTYGGSASELYKSTDGISFSQDMDFGSKSIKDHHVSENEKFYLIMNTASASVEETSRYNGSIQTLGTGKSFTFLREGNDVVYLSDWDFSDSSSIISLHTNYDVMDVIKIAYASFPVKAQATIMFENEFNFLFRFGQADEDILKLTGSPSAGIDETQIDLSVHPNPINSGNNLIIRSNTDGHAVLTCSDGRLMKQFEIGVGDTQLSSDFLSPGVYFISFQNRTQRVVVK